MKTKLKNSLLLLCLPLWLVMSSCEKDPIAAVELTDYHWKLSYMILNGEKGIPDNQDCTYCGVLIFKNKEDVIHYHAEMPDESLPEGGITQRTGPPYFKTGDYEFDKSANKISFRFFYGGVLSNHRLTPFEYGLRNILGNANHYIINGKTLTLMDQENNKLVYNATQRVQRPEPSDVL